MLDVDNIHVAYGLCTVLKGLSLNVPDKTIVGILGPNGHGKTTLLKTVSGLLTPYSGSIKFNDKQISGLSSQQIFKLGIVYVQPGRIFPRLTVKEALYLGSYHAWKQKQKRIEDVFELFPSLNIRKNQTIWTLSGGESRMLTLGVGLMSQAKLLLLDEPLTGLSPVMVDAFLNKIKQIRDEMGLSVLFVEQQIGAALDLADKLCLLEKGSIVKFGTREEILQTEYLQRVYLGGQETSAR